VIVGALEHINVTRSFVRHVVELSTVPSLWAAHASEARAFYLNYARPSILADSQVLERLLDPVPTRHSAPRTQHTSKAWDWEQHASIRWKAFVRSEWSSNISVHTVCSPQRPL
jgi:hypothetical protein